MTEKLPRWLQKKKKKVHPNDNDLIKLAKKNYNDGIDVGWETTKKQVEEVVYKHKRKNCECDKLGLRISECPTCIILIGLRKDLLCEGDEK